MPKDKYGMKKPAKAQKPAKAKAKPRTKTLGEGY